KAWEVSYDRPFAEGHGSGRFLFWEVHMVRWLEALGYDVAYTTAFDVSHDPAQVKQARMFLSIANDEYWTVAQRDAVENARGHAADALDLRRHRAPGGRHAADDGGVRDRHALGQRRRAGRSDHARAIAVRRRRGRAQDVGHDLVPPRVGRRGDRRRHDGLAER